MAALLMTGQRHESVFFLAVMNARGQSEVTKIGLNRSPETEPAISKGKSTLVLEAENRAVNSGPKLNAWGSGKAIRPARRKSTSGLHVVERLVGRLSSVDEVQSRNEKRASHHKATWQCASVDEYRKRKLGKSLVLPRSGTSAVHTQSMALSLVTKVTPNRRKQINANRNLVST